MAYTTITKEIAAKCVELSERVGETINVKELATIRAKYENPTPVAKAVKPKTKAKTVRKTKAKK